MRTIAVMNQKGGVGKTTTSVNLAAGLAKRGKARLRARPRPAGARVAAPGDRDRWRYPHDLSHVRRETPSRKGPTSCGTAFVAGSIESRFGRRRGRTGRHPGPRTHPARSVAGTDSPRSVRLLHHGLSPSLGVLTINALSCAEEVMIPLQPHFLALHGLSKLLETVALVTRRLNRKLRVGGIVLCMYETSTRLAADIADDLQAFLSHSDPEAPWAKARIFESRIRRNIKLAKPPATGGRSSTTPPSARVRWTIRVWWTKSLRWKKRPSSRSPRPLKRTHS